VVLALGWQAAKHNAKLRPYALGLLAGLIAFHFYGLGDALALGSKTGVAFWFLLGLLTTLRQISPFLVKEPPKSASGQLAIKK
jgi:hypothetical protein